MANVTEAPRSRSLIRSALVALGGLALVAAGQRLGALVLAAAYAGINLLTAARRREVANQNRRGDIIVERRPRTVDQPNPSASEAGTSSAAPSTKPARSSAQTSTGSGQSSTSPGGKNKGGPLGFYHRFMDRHPDIHALVEKLMKDNVGMLAAFMSWNILTSAVPIIAGLVAISGLFLHSPSSQHAVINHIVAATQGAFNRSTVTSIVHGSVQHGGLLGIIGFIGILWGGSNIGGGFSTAFQAIFEVPGRNFIKEKLIDVGMIFVFTALMLVIVASSAAVPIITGFLGPIKFPALTWAIGILVDVIAAFLLFGAIYIVFPNIKPPLRVDNVWKGALVAAILFTILSQAWGIYAGFQHFNKYGQAIATILILTAWIYFFSLIAMIGAEVTAVGAIEQAKQKGESVGPQTNDSVPQHKVLRNQPAK